MSGRKVNHSAVSRLKQDYVRLKKDPIPYIEAEPLPSNILEWYYVVQGPENSPYQGGYYLGKLVFPREFPFKPPSIYMLTPNGRFKTHMRLCLSISDFHPDTWNPAWSVSTILTGLLSFMLEKSPTLGSIECSDYERRRLAEKSLETILQDRNFCDLFPELAKTVRTELDRNKQREELRASAASISRNSSSGNVRDLIMGTIGVANGQQMNQNGFYNIMSNVGIIFGFAAFAYAVKYILLSISHE
ncbi:hypothetical protein V9T40_000553 [Parthenolecanium corni]|uniref:Ubiquitin-conjugating enzyme E2 J2 n=1 Tax=Parthenolecanium corni TaxID=536013 RepID=A0AAN9TD38_9HEMI